MTIRWSDYDATKTYDELITPNGRPRKVARAITRYLASLDAQELEAIETAAEVAIKEMGVTFTVYCEAQGSIDRAWPLDIIPRVMSGKE